MFLRFVGHADRESAIPFGHRRRRAGSAACAEADLPSVDALNGIFDDFGPDSSIGVDFQKQGVPFAPVDNVDFADPAAQGLQTGLTLGIMPFSMTPSRISAWAWLAVSELISEAGSSFFRRTPLTSLM